MAPKRKEVTDAETEKFFEKKEKELRKIKKNDPRRKGNKKDIGYVKAKSSRTGTFSRRATSLLIAVSTSRL